MVQDAAIAGKYMGSLIGQRVALPMRRGVVRRSNEYGFWIQLDGAPEDICVWVNRDEPWLEERLEPPEARTLAERIAHAINVTGSENGSNTPDFILAEYLTSCLKAFDHAVATRAQWFHTNFPDAPPQPSGDDL